MKARSKIPLTDLRQLASRYGIQTEHRDMFGKRTVASADSLIATLQALGAPIFRMEDIPAALREYEAFSRRSGLEPVAVAWDGKPGDMSIRLDAMHAKGRARCRVVFEDGLLQEWELKLEDLRTIESAELAGRHHLSLRLPATNLARRRRLPLGYHRFQLECRGGAFDSLLIAAPQRAFDVPGAAWGVFLPLYSLASRESWGAGDFSDLEKLVDWTSAVGGTVVSTVPLMAAFFNHPLEISPYMSASRLFWNELYVDPRKSPEYVECSAARRLVHSNFFERDVAALRSLPQVDHRRVMALKRPVLEAMAQWLLKAKSARTAAFLDYVEAHPRLRDYARFRATVERQKAPWPAWPQRLRSGKLKPGDFDPADETYHQYAQWLAEEQLQRLSAKRDGRAGLYLDFPLGVHPYSYDVWRNPERFALQASTGAPPDSLFTKGQKWGFPPPHPGVMRRQGYAYFIASLRHQFRHTRWVRIDHVMGLHRLFWIPEGRPASEGVYVHYPAEELYAILCLESHCSKTVVVGENLGTVPPEVNRAMGERGLKPMYVLQYEAQPHPEKCLGAVPANAVASLNTHDMPPFAAFWEGSDLRDLQEIGLLDRKEAEEQVRSRRKVCQALGEFLPAKPSYKRSAAAAGAIMQRCQEWLASSRAKMVLVNLEDLWLETAPQNVPGTSLERPNWQRKARHSLEEFGTMAGVANVLRSIRGLRSTRRANSRAK
ncbi:MAG: 4-alpha-glucanotransferase [Acidobacteria bacterium]|nr:4-alpha-glucanotransferase [Acidobacteriota bacterium]